MRTRRGNWGQPNRAGSIAARRAAAGTAISPPCPFHRACRLDWVSGRFGVVAPEGLCPGTTGGGWLKVRFRRDIQGLRGVAVLAVVLYHAKVAFVRGGYVGVDVFFVISGFLISTLLWGELRE